MNVFLVGVICIVMAIVTFGVSYLPLAVKELSQERINIISLCSVGILVSATLCIILPESIETITSSDSSNSIYIGYSLLIGFVIMFAIDSVSKSLANEPPLQNQWEEPVIPMNSKRQQIKTIFQTSLTLALILHGLIDGIALGSALKNEDVSFVVAAIIIIHKLPTCFSLCCLLLKQGLEKSVIKLHLGVFALTTPISALLTWLVLSMINSDDFLIGVLLLFSSGNFIYIITHLLSDDIDLNQLIYVFAGMLIPCILSLFHD